MNKTILSRILLICSLCICMSAARAQYVSIPDSNFGIWLNQNGYSSCLTSNGNNGNWQLDTTCPALFTSVSLNFSCCQFNYTGVQYIKGLDSLNVGDININLGDTIPPFPPSLKYLYFNSLYSNNHPFTLPDSLQWLGIGSTINDSLPFAFPSHMIGFDCNGSLLYLPQLPVTLRYLNLDGTDFPGLPATLPDSLRYLNCAETNLAYIPTLPPFLDTLIVADNFQYLDSLPALPSSLVYLDCSDNYLTSLPALPASLTYLNCSLQEINTPLTSLPALPSSLVYLDCSENWAITNLPALPSTLRYLNCSNNQTVTLPTLPALTYLNCSANPLHSLPATLPSTLTYLDCSEDLLSVMPAFPAGLTYINCSYNQLSILPALPAPLTNLNCSNNQLSTLPTLTGAITLMSCSNNLLTALPVLPASLTNFDCGYNRISVLPALPPSLYELDCPHNLIASLPALPATLGILECDSNSLTGLPTLYPQLRALSCRANQLTSLPTLPDTLLFLDCSRNPNLYCLPRIPDYLTAPGVQLYFSPYYAQSYLLYSQVYFGGMYIAGSGISCMPNQFLSLEYTYDFNPDTFPLCTPASGCAFYYNISGNVHLDTAATCAGDSINPGNALRNFKISLLQSGQVVQQSYLTDLGQYSFKTDSFTNYVVQIDTIAAYGLSPACPSSAAFNVSLSSVDTVSIANNFGLDCSAFDAGIVYIYGPLFHPGFIREVNVEAGNQAYFIYNANCGVNSSGTMITIISGPAQYLGPGPGGLTPTTVSASGDTLIYSISDIDSLTPYSFNINVMTDSTAVLGSSVCITGIITPATPDANPADDTLTQCFTVSNSLDPNLKTVYPTTLTPDGGWLTYTVEFQNTGNDTAYTVVVRDTLSPYVDASSFQYIASDHKAVIQLMGNAMVFTFPRINLVDSATNPPLSTGWIQYKVKAKANLPLNTQVKNTAYVYFDINPAVVTNTTVNTVDTITQPLAIRTIAASNTIRLYPNPNKGSFTLLTTGSINSSYTITDMLGNVIAQQTITSSTMQIDLSDASEGVYTLAVKGAQPIRFVVVR